MTPRVHAGTQTTRASRFATRLCGSAFSDRDAAGYRKTYRNLAWGSFAWFVSEPDKLLVLHDGVVELDALLPFDP